MQLEAAASTVFAQHTQGQSGMDRASYTQAEHRTLIIALDVAAYKKLVWELGKP